jgi:ATP-dependent phosphofructokinase / diphosphate-dependent phosphofructokinase
MKPIRTVGIVNGGGDAPGLNPVIRAIVRSAINAHGMRVVGIRNGFDGLIWPEGAKEMTEETVSGILPRGGTILGTTNRGNPFAYKSIENGQEVVHDYSSLCMDNARPLGIDAMIGGGGDGTQHIARDFFRKGVNIVGVPKTIDNDLDATEVTFGFDTALVIATEAIDRLHTTAESHHRVMLIEVMGRDAGWIALHSGIAGGAHIILVPEIPFTFECVCDGIRSRELRGKHFSLIVVAEGVKLPTTDPNGKPVPPARPGEVASTIGYTLRDNAAKRDSRDRAGTRPTRRLAYALRPHPGHAVRSGCYRFGGKRAIRAHGLPKSWQNGIGVTRRSA